MHMMDTPMPRLYHLPLSPFCRKLRLILAEKRIEVELVEEKPWERRMEYLILNPSGQVPLLQIDGLNLGDSAAAAEYIEETVPEPSLMPETPTERAEVRRIVQWFDGKFHQEVTSNLLYERVNKKLMKSGYPESAAIKAGSSAIKYHLDYMDWLLDQRKWLCGEKMTLADFTAAAHFSCLDYTNDVDWDRSAHVRDWYARIKSRPAFRTLLSDTLPGFTPPEHYADLDF